MSGCAAATALRPRGMLPQRRRSRYVVPNHHDGAVGAPFAFGPFVDANHPASRPWWVWAHRFTHRKSVSLLTESPIRRASRSPGRPPSAYPINRMMTFARARAAPAELRDVRRRSAKKRTGTRAGAASPPTDANLEARPSRRRPAGPSGCARSDCDEPWTPAGDGGTWRGQAPEPSPSTPRRFARRWSM